MGENKIKYVPMIIIASILTLGLIISTFIVANSFVKTRPTNGIITVTGSAKKQIKSDFAVWSGNFSTQAVNLKDCYKIVKENQSTVKEYLIKNGIPEDQISFLSINTTINYARDYQGYNTNQIDSYRLSQTVEIKSNDVDKISVLARESTELIDKGIEFQSYQPQYFYTKIADLKVDMLALASKDAKDRAEKIASNSKSQILGVKTAKMGVFQITPLYSNEISDYGINDTNSIDKEIMSVMNCEFKIK